MSTHPLKIVVEGTNDFPSYGRQYDQIVYSYKSAVESRSYKNAKDWLEALKKEDERLAKLGEP
jgi:hypothetical protein